MEGAALGLVVEGMLPMALGQRVGVYGLVDVIASGGMGTVYQARRADGRLDQLVAVKIIRKGMETSHVLQRFRREQQALARLVHPNIARFLDAGVTEQGLPYLVLELIEGRSLGSYCDEKKLTIKKRLELFGSICQAIQFAHRNLIIHRDFKPGNILVTDDGTVKILDFGIAKLLDPDGRGDNDEQTLTALRVMTPQYASPEQISGEPTTTATDIYSLGVILYELMAGHRPYEVKELPRVEAERLICLMEPTTPSAVISRTLELPQSDGGTRRVTPATVAAVREGSPERLRRRLIGDVDTIVLKSMHKDPARRYTSAEALSEDIRRHLQGLPILAQPDSVRYRFNKFVRRNKVIVIAAVLVSISLLGGVIGTSMGLVRAQRARAEAEAEAARADAEDEAERARTAAATTNRISEFLQSILAAADPYEESQDITVREILDRAAGKVDVGLTAQLEVQVAVLNIIGSSYRSLGLYAEAEFQLQRALVVWREIRVEDGLEVADTLNRLANVAHSKGDLGQAERLHRESIAIEQSLLELDSPNMASQLHNLGRVMEEKGDYTQAEKLLRQALTIQRRSGAEDHEAMILFLTSLGRLLEIKGDYEESETMQERGVELARAHLRTAHPLLASALSSLGHFRLQMGESEAAEALYIEAIGIFSKTLGEEHPNTLSALNSLARALREQEKNDEAEAVLRKVVELRQDQFGPEHQSVANSLNTLGLLLQARGEYDEAESIFERVVKIYRAALGEKHYHVAIALNNLATVLRAKGQYANAEQLYRKSLSMRRALFGDNHRAVAGILNNLGGLLEDNGDLAAAESYYHESLRIHRTLFGNQHPDVAVCLHNLGGLLHQNERSAEAEPLLRDCLSIREACLPSASPLVSKTKGLLGACLVVQRQFGEAELLLIDSYSFAEDQGRRTEEPRQIALERLVHLYEAWNKPAEAAEWRAKLPVADELASSQPRLDAAATSQPVAGQAAAGIEGNQAATATPVSQPSADRGADPPSHEPDPVHPG